MRIPKRAKRKIGLGLATLRVLALLAVAMVLGVTAVPNCGGDVAFASESTAASTSRVQPATSAIGERYSINITSVTGGPGSVAPNYTNPITVAGNVSATNFAGQPDQYHVQVDWGDGKVNPDSILNLLPSETGKDFTGIWESSPSHSYVEGGTYTIAVTLYHQRYPGAEKSDLARATISIVISLVTYFEFAPISSNQTAGVPFSITIMAKDQAGNTVTSYTSTANLTDLSASISPNKTTAFSTGVWSGNVTISTARANDTITATDGAITGTSNPFNVTPFIPPPGRPAIGGVVYDADTGSGLGGVTIQLSGTDTRSTLTLADGSYIFTTLPVGSYKVKETNPPGYISTTPDEVTVNVTGTNTYTVNFGDRYVPPPSRPAIAGFLQSGGVTFGEGCSEGQEGEKGAKEFGIAFNRLANQLNCKLGLVQRGHPLLSAVHIFSEVPSGAEPGMLMEGGNIIYSGSDYGCAWQGGHEDHPLSRDIIRSSFEIGINIILYAQMTKAAKLGR